MRDRRCQVVNAGTYHLSQTLGDKPGRLLSVGGKIVLEIFLVLTQIFP